MLMQKRDCASVRLSPPFLISPLTFIFLPASQYTSVLRCFILNNRLIYLGFINQAFVTLIAHKKVSLFKIRQILIEFKKVTVFRKDKINNLRWKYAKYLL